jgi:excisionase family DNA binding protein
MSTSVLPSGTSVLAQEIAEELIRRGVGSSKPVIQKRILTLKEAAEYLGRSESGIRHLVSKGILTSVEFDAKICFDIRDLDRAIEEAKR